MKTTTLDQAGERAAASTLGHVGPKRAGGKIHLIDSAGTEVNSDKIRFTAPVLTYDDDDEAIIDLGGSIDQVDDGTTIVVDVDGITVPPGGLTDLGSGAILLNFLTNRWGEQHTTYTNAAAGAALTLDLAAYNVFDLTHDANCTLSFSNPPVSGVMSEWTLILRQGGVGSFTVTWPGTVDWQDTDGTGGGAAPTLYTAVGAVDVIRITTLDGGTSYGGGQERAAAAGLASPLTTKGDLWGYDTADARVPVGTNGYLLVADSTDAQGVVWENPETTGHYEVLMDGAGNPLDNGSGLDWLWVWVA